MAEFEKEVTKTVVEKRKYKQCDYCQLMTTNDINDDEEFGEIMLNPKIVRNNGFIKYKTDSLARDIKRAENEDEARNIIQNIMELEVEETADLCPGCVESLFSEGPATGIRMGTGMLEEDE